MVEAKIHAVNATKYPADKADKWSALPLDNDATRIHWLCMTIHPFLSLSEGYVVILIHQKI